VDSWRPGFVMKLNKDNRDDCEACSGSGIVLFGEQKGDDCPVCKGTGKVNDE
jgi:DnaJ-class molecular chaperone